MVDPITPTVTEPVEVTTPEPITPPVIEPPASPAGQKMVPLFGEEVFMSAEQAARIIPKRDDRINVLKSSTAKTAALEASLADATSKLANYEAIHNEHEAITAQKVSAAVEQYKAKVVQSDLLGALLANDQFLDTPSNRQDALALLQASNKYELGDDNNILAGEKSVSDTVTEFLSTRDAFKKAGKGTPKRQSKPASVDAPKKKTSLRDGIKKHLNLE